VAKNKQLDNLNECARLLYEGMGYHVDKGYDFSIARHTQEQACFALAVRTFNFWERVIGGRKTQDTKEG
jgi:hypothetical protein